MRHAVSFIFNAVRDARVAMTDVGHGTSSQLEAAPMVQLDATDLRNVAGGDDSQLPKGGWIVA